MFKISLNAIRGDDAPSIRRLFRYFGLTPEDSIIPASSIELLWWSQEHADLIQLARSEQQGTLHQETGTRMWIAFSSLSSGQPSAFTIRKWATVLLDRSLLLGSMIKGLKIQCV